MLDKIQLGAIDIDGAVSGTPSADDLLIFKDTSDGKVKKGEFNSLNLLLNKFTSVDELATGKFNINEVVCLEDRGYNLFKIVSGVVSDGFGILPAGTGKVAEAIINGNVKASAFGVTEGALTYAINRSNSLMVPLDLCSKTYTITTPCNLPTFGIVGSGKITGAECIWGFNKTTITSGGYLEFDSLTLDSLWDASFKSKLKVLNQLTLQSSSSAWGMYWNDFGDMEILGKILIDVDKGGSINQNDFGNTRAYGGVHIKGDLLV
ncbi:MAG: hypothetical protein ACRC91_00795, partial [Aeromonas sp.]